jgi:hypothetical protein
MDSNEHSLDIVVSCRHFVIGLEILLFLTIASGHGGFELHR